MDPSDDVTSNEFPEEKLPEGIDEDASWFSKNLGDESDNTEHEVLNPQINQDDLNVDLDSVKDSELVEDNEGVKSSDEMMETDSQSELLAEMSEESVQKSSLVTLEPKKEDELTELKDIAIDSKKHDISNELKEMFEEKSSDAEELHETSLSKHSLDSEITKEDKLKDIVPDDILGKDDSFDELDNDALHQELEAHLTYGKNKELIEDLPDTVQENLPSEIQESQVDNIEHEVQGSSKLESESEMSKSLEDLNFEGKTDLLKNLAENIDAKEIDEIMEQGMPCDEDAGNKDMTTELKEISSDLEAGCVDQIKDDLENQLHNITGENVEDQLQNIADDNVKNELESLPDESEEHELQNIHSIETNADQSKEATESENAINEELVNQVDKSSIELNQENMMVEFAKDDSGNQVLIQINEDKTESSYENADSISEAAGEQTLTFSTESVEASSSENDMISQVEGGAEFLQAVTGKLEDVLVPVKEESVKEDAQSPQKKTEAPTDTAAPNATAVTPVLKNEVKDEPPKCCIATCKSGKSTLKTTYRYFKPPANKMLYRKWEYIFNQARQQLTPTSLICELHFRTGLIYKRGCDRFGKIVWALREGALPKLSPSGVLRATPGTPTPSTTVLVPKKQESAVKTPVAKPPTPLTESVSRVSSISNTTPKILPKKILQKPVKTVANKVTNDVTDIGFLYKNPELIKVAQDEIANLDVLVCGECHSVFHILELFQAHKMADNCRGESNFKGNPNEPKAQVWAFLLWKSAQARVSDVDSSWRLYQRWCKMDEELRNTWIAAGKALQEGNSIASLKLFDPPVKNKVGRPPLRDRDSEDEDYTVRKSAIKKQKTQKNSSADVEYDGSGDAKSYAEIEPMEVENSQVSPAKPDERAYDQTLEELSRHSPEMITAEVEIKQEILSDEERGENKENDIRHKELDDWYCTESDEIQNCSRCKRPITNLRGGILCAAGCYGYFHVECTRLKTVTNLSKLGVRKQTWKCDVCKHKDKANPTEKPQPISSAPTTMPQKSQEKDTEEEEFVVEKIVSRRYNIKKKHFEYLLKWEGYPSEQNTWEPAENLGTCQHLLKAFEEALAKQQAAKAAAMNKQPPDTTYKVKPPVIPKRKADPVTPGPSTTPTVLNCLGRPVRSSKKKAMDQVKVWCGSIVKPSEDDNVGTKRKLSSDSEYEDDEEEVVVKRVKIEMDSDDSDASSARRAATHVTPSRGRGRPPGSTNAAKMAQTNYLNKPVMNGDQNNSNLAASLGLESDEDDAVASQISPVIRKMSSLSPHNQQVLVASAKGVVTVDPKKVPNLSSGVYIMSNKSGIVKVDNNKTLSTLQKSGVLKKPISPSKIMMGASPEKGAGGVVVLPRSEAGAPPQKSGVMKKTVAPTPTTPSTVSTPGRPAGLLKPLRPGVSPRPLGLLKPSTPATGSPTSSTVTPPNTPTTPTTVTASPRPSLTPAAASPGISSLPRPQLLAKPRGGISSVRGRPLASPLVKRPVDSPAMQAASLQQRMMIAKKKAESEASDGESAAKRPLGVENKLSALIKPKLETGLTPLPPIKSTNKVFAHPLLGRGRGRGSFRGRGRGAGPGLSHLMQTSQREMVQPDPVKDSKLIDSDNLLMEFQEPSDSEDSDDGLDDGFPPLEELPPIVPDSPPRPLTLCPLTGKVLCKAEGEKTPEPTPPPSPKAPTPPPPPATAPVEEPTHILPDHQDEIEATPELAESPVTVTHTSPHSVMAATHPTTTTTVVKQDGMICKVEMSPGGTTGTLLEAVSADTSPPVCVTEGTVTIKKPLASRNRLNRGPQLSVMPTNSTSTSLGTITVPARKLFQEENEDDLVTITGEDGMVYQVSNSELAGNTLLVSSGEDGQQQCVYVTTDGDGTEEGSTILTLDTAYADAVAQLGTDQVNILSTENGDQFYIKEGDDGGQLMALEEEEGVMAGDDQSGQVVAQLVEAGEPAPGGSRRVVLLLPDGNLMMTEVDEEQYAALDLDK